ARRPRAAAFQPGPAHAAGRPRGRTAVRRGWPPREDADPSFRPRRVGARVDSIAGTRRGRRSAGGGPRQADDEAGAPLDVLVEPEVAALGAGQPPAQGQAQADAGRTARGFAIGARERPEEATAVRLREPGPMVAEADQ